MYVHIHTHVCKPGEGIGSLELELQVPVSCLTWALEVELQSSGRAARAPHC